MLSEGVGYSWGFIVVAMYGGMTSLFPMEKFVWVMDNFEYAKKCGNSILYFMMINGDGRMSTELLYNYLSYNYNINL